MFNVRVYGLCINEKQEILTCKEGKAYNYVLKFPGGGLEYGEGLKEALLREFEEELGVSVEIKKHIYTTDFFQKSYFDNSQVIAIYYEVKPPVGISFPCTIGELEFRYQAINELLLFEMQMPIDKYVLQHFYLSHTLE